MIFVQNHKIMKFLGIIREISISCVNNFCRHDDDEMIEIFLQHKQKTIENEGIRYQNLKNW